MVKVARHVTCTAWWQLLLRGRSAAFSRVDKHKLVALVQSCQSSHDVDVARTLWLCSLIYGTRPKPCSTAHATPGRDFASLKQFLEDQLAQLNKALEKAKEDVAEFTTKLVAGRDSFAEELKAFHQEGVLSCSRSVRLAQFCNFEVWCWRWCGSICESAGFDQGPHLQQVAGGRLVRGEPETLFTLKRRRRRARRRRTSRPML